MAIVDLGGGGGRVSVARRVRKVNTDMCGASRVPSVGGEGRELLT